MTTDHYSFNTELAMDHMIGEEMDRQLIADDRRNWIRDVLIKPFPFCIGRSRDDGPLTEDQLKFVFAVVILSGIDRDDFWVIDDRPELYGFSDEEGNEWHWKLRQLRNDGPDGYNLGNMMFGHLERRQRLIGNVNVRMFSNREIRRFGLKYYRELVIHNTKSPLMYPMIPKQG